MKTRVAEALSKRIPRIVELPGASANADRPPPQIILTKIVFFSGYELAKRICHQPPLEKVTHHKYLNNMSLDNLKYSG